MFDRAKLQDNHMDMWIMRSDGTDMRLLVKDGKMPMLRPTAKP